MRQALFIVKVMTVMMMIIIIILIKSLTQAHHTKTLVVKTLVVKTLVVKSLTHTNQEPHAPREETAGKPRHHKF